MSAPNEPSSDPQPADHRRDPIGDLAALGPDAQGEIDESLLRDNLARTPLQRLQGVNEAATQIEQLRRAMKIAGHA